MNSNKKQIALYGPSVWGLELAQMKIDGDRAGIARELARIRSRVPELEQVILAHAKKHFEQLKGNP